MKPADFPSDLPYEDVLRMVAEHPTCPEIEETKELVRQDLEQKVLLGEITQEQRCRLLAILSVPARFSIPLAIQPHGHP